MKKLVMAAVLVALAACAPKDDAGMAGDSTMMMPAMSDTMNMMDTSNMMMDSNMVDSAMARDSMRM